ncbi:amidohydrolase family protein [Mycobacterium sp.]|uniref:amidohydrolase family protein n=1 Tax=Mycobacterium sp. TaxID=1785 RepID=UPI0012161D8A|nr:amidohydrolase family protein [Mycobacterium sp.]TAM65246.1 MAG: amidohydrolase [Mycobacterium sp.]
METPKIISVDDHVIEPPTLWQARLPEKYRDIGPRVVRKQGRMTFADGALKFEESSDAPVVDLWLYEDLVWPIPRGMAQVGHLDEMSASSINYDDIAPGCWQQGPRLTDLAANHTDGSLSFPSFPRFCGQTFAERKDKELALLCVKAYNDWMIDEWCAGAGAGVLIPLTLIPLWDPELAAAEVRRCADKGSFAVAFSENPVPLGLPSIHGPHWDPFLRACEESHTVINMHIGSSSQMAVTAPDAPLEAGMALTAENSVHAFVDWLTSGVFARRPGLKAALSEGQVGWMPFMIERLDSVWERSHFYGDRLRDVLPEPPSSYIAGHLYGCVFDDVEGLLRRDVVGMSQIMFETDYPHSDSTFPHSRETAEKLVQRAGLDEQETYQLLRGNAIECFGLERLGFTK